MFSSVQNMCVIFLMIFFRQKSSVVDKCVFIRDVDGWNYLRNLFIYTTSEVSCIAPEKIGGGIFCEDELEHCLILSNVWVHLCLDNAIIYHTKKL